MLHYAILCSQLILADADLIQAAPHCTAFLILCAPRLHCRRYRQRHRESKRCPHQKRPRPRELQDLLHMFDHFCTFDFDVKSCEIIGQVIRIHPITSKQSEKLISLEHTWTYMNTISSRWWWKRCLCPTLNSKRSLTRKKNDELDELRGHSSPKFDHQWTWGADCSCNVRKEMGWEGHGPISQTRFFLLDDSTEARLRAPQSLSWIDIAKGSLEVRFWPEKLPSCQRNSFGFCNLVLANRIGVVAASMLLCGCCARSSTVATRCLQIAFEWLCQCCSSLLLRTRFFGRLQSTACKSHWSGRVNVALCYCCARSSMVFCSLLLVNPIGMVAPKLRRWVSYFHCPFLL